MNPLTGSVIAIVVIGTFLLFASGEIAWGGVIVALALTVAFAWLFGPLD